MSVQYPNQNLRDRTLDYALRFVHLSASLSNTREAWVLGKQVLRSGTSVGAHYREACRARSKAEFISKMEGGLQELDETDYWLELLWKGGIVPEKRLTNLIQETNELLAIFTSSVCTAKREKQ